jgi:hypothetical protein
LVKVKVCEHERRVPALPPSLPPSLPSLTVMVLHGGLEPQRHQVGGVQIRVHSPRVRSRALPRVKHEVVVQIVGRGRCVGRDGFLVVGVDDLGGREGGREGGLGDAACM